MAIQLAFPFSIDIRHVYRYVLCVPAVDSVLFTYVLVTTSPVARKDFSATETTYVDKVWFTYD